MKKLSSQQDILNYVVKFFSKQGRLCIRKNPRDVMEARYRHKNYACAAGCLISDRLYEPRIENNVFSIVMLPYVRDRVKIKKFNKVELANFIADIQSKHDEASTLVEFIEDLRSFAVKVGLKTNKLDKYNWKKIDAKMSR